MSIGALAAGLVVLTLGLPLWAGLAVLVDIARRHFRLPVTRLVLFAVAWCWIESAGVVGLFLLWVTGRAGHARPHYALQRWWCGAIISALRMTVGLRLDIQVAEPGPRGPFVVLCRHASLADSIISCFVVSNMMGLAPRYVLKTELQAMPCLDILGHRTPNAFIRRGSADVRSELGQLEAMASGMGPGDAAVIFPEGSRSNDAKRARELARLEARHPHRHAALSGLRHLIPPKPAGALALLRAAPGADILTLWHEGLDGLDTFRGMIRELSARRVTARFRAVVHPRANVPCDDGFEAWLDARWVEIDAQVAALATAR